MTKGEGGAGISYPTYYAEPGDGFDAARFDFYRFRRDASRASAVRSLFRHSSSTVVASRRAVVPEQDALHTRLDRLAVQDGEQDARADVSERAERGEEGGEDDHALDLVGVREEVAVRADVQACLLYTSPSPRDATLSRMPSSA